MTGDDFLRNAMQAGALVSGRPVPPDFERGWGRPPFLRGKMIAHHWTADRDVDLGPGIYGLRSACGLLTVATPQVPLCGEGNLPFCVRCENRLMKNASQAAA
jgi:hypothetical protein